MYVCILTSQNIIRAQVCDTSGFIFVKKMSKGYLSLDFFCETSSSINQRKEYYNIGQSHSALDLETPYLIELKHNKVH
jgi:hypothetical protein